MTAASGDINRLQEQPLAGITLIEIELSQADLLLESDPALEELIQVVTEPDKSQVALNRSGSKVQISQVSTSRRSSNPVIVRLPLDDLPPIACSITRGSSTFDNLNTSITYKGSRGDINLNGGVGALTMNVARGDVFVRERTGAIVCNAASGDIRLESCSGPLTINKSSGDLLMTDSGGAATLNVKSGDVIITRPFGQRITTDVKKGDVLIKDGSLAAVNVRVAKGDIVSKSRLLLPSQQQATEVADDDFDWEDDDDVGEQPSSGTFLGGLEIEAGEQGVRIRRGGKDIIRAGEDGVRIGQGERGGIYVGPEGVKIGTSEGEDAPKGFTFATRKGDVMLVIPDDVAARVELLSSRGDISSDIPLVEVGRPGPKGATRRYVGATDSADGERLLVRAKSDHGDISIKKGSMSAGMATGERTDNKDEQIREVLVALANEQITVAEAETLIAAIERGY